MKPAPVLALFLCACTNTTPPAQDSLKKDSAKIECIMPGPDYPLKAFEWLNGSWNNTDKEGSYTESWVKTNDSTFTGKSYMIIGKDTVSSETITLEHRMNEVFYVPVVKNQNDGKPVRFKMTLADKGTFVFQNPEHDFPQQIKYVKVTTDSLYAEISGTKKGKTKAIPFPMKRIK